MDTQASLTVAAAVVALTQLFKWSRMIPDKFGPLAVLVLSALGVAFWGYSEGTFERATAFEYFAGWIGVCLQAAGVYGFTRAAGTAVTNALAPPASGAGSSPTIKEG